MKPGICILQLLILVSGGYLFFFFDSDRDKHLSDNAFLRAEANVIELDVHTKPIITDPKNTTHQPHNQTHHPNTTTHNQTHPSKNKTESDVILGNDTNITFRSERTKNDNQCLQMDTRIRQLCKFISHYCKRYTPTEELESFWMVAAIYTADQPSRQLLYELHRNYINYIKLFGFQTQVIEVIFPNQEYQVTSSHNPPYELQYKAEWIFNMRENLVNVGSKKLPDDWEYIAWIDAHIFWDENRYFFEDVVVLLGKKNIVHMLGSNDFYDVNNRSHFHEEGMAKLYEQYKSPHLPPIRQCGMAWATRRDVFEAIHGLLDVCIGTKCDLYQNYAYIGMTYTGEATNPEYARAIQTWQQNALQVFLKKIGYVRGNIIHFEHCINGCKTSSYDTMTQLLMRYNFNPNTDLSKDEEGRYQFKNNWNLAKELWIVYGGRPR